MQNELLGKQSSGLEVCFDPEIYPRTEINEAKVEEYVEAFKAGFWPPPIKITPDGRLLDGRHRIEAARRVGQEQLQKLLDEAEIVEGGLTEAIQFNIQHGLPLTLGEKRRLAVRLYAQGMATKDVAKLFRVTSRTIERWTKESRKQRKQDEVGKIEGLREEGYSVRTGVQVC